MTSSITRGTHSVITNVIKSRSTWNLLRKKKEKKKALGGVQKSSNIPALPRRRTKTGTREHFMSRTCVVRLRYMIPILKCLEASIKQTLEVTCYMKCLLILFSKYLKENIFRFFSVVQPHMGIFHWARIDKVGYTFLS